MTHSPDTGLSYNVLAFGGRRIINVRGPGYEVQFDMLSGETMQEALRRHHTELDKRAERLKVRRDRAAMVLARAP